jgi:glycolate oxidase iron-sulfur subunit
VRDEAAAARRASHGPQKEAHAAACRNIDAWFARIIARSDAILTTASGFGTTMKDYGFMLRNDPDYAAPAAKISSMCRDISEFINEIKSLEYVSRPPLVFAYYPFCSLAHGQRVTEAPKVMLSEAGFVLKDIPESHLCCGSAGTYNMLQPELANRLRDRKIANIDKVTPELIAAGNSCHPDRSGAHSGRHPIELIDWATGAVPALERTRWSMHR